MSAMHAFHGFKGLFVKEVEELLREKRLFSILAFFGIFLGILYTVFIVQMLRHGHYVPQFNEGLVPLAYILPIGLLIVALTFTADCVSKEKDNGMLALILSSPVTPLGLVTAKIAAGFLVYGVVAIFLLLYGVVLALSTGWASLLALAWMLAVPLLAYYVFLLGVGVFVSVVTKSSRAAVGLAFAVFLPTFFLMQEPPGLGFLIRMVAPRVYAMLDLNPMGMAVTSSAALVNGAPFAWTPVVVSVVLGVSLMVAAYFTFRRQEVVA